MLKYTKACEKPKFENGLCVCCGECGTCCYTLFCYPCASGHAWAESRGETCALIHTCVCEVFIRSNIRHARNMPIKYCSDCCAHMFCPCCTLVQDIKEIKSIQAESQIEDEPKEVTPPPINIPPSPPNDQSTNNSSRSVSVQDDESSYSYEDDEPIPYYNGYPNQIQNPNPNPNLQQGYPSYPTMQGYPQYPFPQPYSGTPVYVIPAGTLPPQGQGSLPQIPSQQLIAQQQPIMQQPVVQPHRHHKRSKNRDDSKNNKSTPHVQIQASPTNSQLSLKTAHQTPHSTHSNSSTHRTPHSNSSTHRTPHSTHSNYSTHRTPHSSSTKD